MTLSVLASFRAETSATDREDPGARRRPGAARVDPSWAAPGFRKRSWAPRPRAWRMAGVISETRMADAGIRRPRMSPTRSGPGRFAVAITPRLRSSLGARNPQAPDLGRASLSIRYQRWWWRPPVGRTRLD